MSWPLSQLADYVDGELVGDGQCQISGVATITNAGTGDLTFLANDRYRRYLSETRASAVIVSPNDRKRCPTACIVTPNPYLAFARIATLLHPLPRRSGGIHPLAFVDPDAMVSESAWVGPFAVVQAGTKIGDHCEIGPHCIIGEQSELGSGCRLIGNVTICDHCSLGDHVILHPGVVIGSDGFGMANENGKWIKVPQMGRVVIGSDVEIGANTTIDRGALDDTVIEDGVKLDNQIQVAHNVRIGAHTVIAACTGISGSTDIGQRCIIGGGVGAAGHLEIADDVHITGMTMVTKSIREPGVYSSGMPVSSNREWRRNMARLHQLENIVQRIKRLEDNVDQRKKDS